ncbi:cobalamin-binding protein [Massilia sp. CFBP9012]|uniref:cobalamin-binding protein n=1 Tax=Massilia sp. CFBP9012 TaxID=3096531 RepID=UPI002A6AFC63|nr:cobalamin-binding protein [Massilia sp. CFBP9012]MDY0976435.1 cobalamin-binding protein [Massilia sp. CFBP9012]
MKRLIGLVLAVLPAFAGAGVTVVDDVGRTVTLAQPARRVVSLAPHVTELLYAAGGGARVVGAVNYSDYPEAAKKLPQVGSYNKLDFERLLALKPDLVVVWHSGNPTRQVEQLERLGIPVYHSEPGRLAQIGDSLLRLGRLLGTEPAAQAAARDYGDRIAALKARYASRPQVGVFYQVWPRPLYTLNDDHIASDMVRLCGGRNLFGAVKTIAPEVGVEAVIEADPEVILVGGRDKPDDPGGKMWQAFKGMTAVRRDNIFTIDGDLTNRAGPRTAEGAAQLCAMLEQARGRRPR